MSLVEVIIGRLDDAGTPFRVVGGAAGLAVLEQRRTRTPAAFVMVAEEASGANERMTGPVLQRLETDIAVVLVLENLGDPRGGTVADDIEALKAFVRARLIGFRPDSAAEPMEHVSGELLKVRGGAVWAEERFSCARFLEELP
ncbi:hypothetical protein GCM10011316_28940 [Roseibium aquae]|uniref:Uncharacterized protein n=2 Tax=Roseibium aquae TaxID=1323746 RepID=A0A916X2I8_9HYPH|nr:hypothetical protein [Roseibium aquae]GGB55066.1 hypothetical protein GCM10011316_28940 [Roseibium aquae]